MAALRHSDSGANQIITVTLVGEVAQRLVLAGNGGTTTLNISAGDLTITGDANSAIRQGAGGKGTLNLSGGTLTLNGGNA